MIVAFGVGVMVGLNAALLRSVVASAERPAPVGETWEEPAATRSEPAAEHTVLGRDDGRATASLDRVNEKLRECHGFLVDTESSPLGIVDEVETNPEGIPVAIVVSGGWFGRRQYRVPADAVIAASSSERRLIVDAARVRET